MARNIKYGELFGNKHFIFAILTNFVGIFVNEFHLGFIGNELLEMGIDGKAIGYIFSVYTAIFLMSCLSYPYTV